MVHGAKLIFIMACVLSSTAQMHREYSGYPGYQVQRQQSYYQNPSSYAYGSSYSGMGNRPYYSPTAINYGAFTYQYPMSGCTGCVRCVLLRSQGAGGLQYNPSGGQTPLHLPCRDYSVTGGMRTYRLPRREYDISGVAASAPADYLPPSTVNRVG